MKKGLGIIYLSFSVLFYLGIVCVLYLYRIDDNTYKWMMAEAMVFFGILISVAIPDMLISIDVDTVSISASRAAIINKYLVFCIVFTLTNKFFWGVTVLVGISMLIGLVIESMLLSQILSADISIRQFTERLNAVDTSVVDGVLKYYGIYILGIVFYLNLHSNIYEPDYVVVVDDSLLEAVDVTAGLKPDGAIVINTTKTGKELKPLLNGYTGKVYTIDARKISLETLGKYFPNTPMLAAIVKVSGVIEEKDFLADMEGSFKHKFAKKPEVIDGNMKALEMSFRGRFFN